MSFEATVAQLVAQTNQALALPQQIADMATQKVSEVGAAYVDRISRQKVTMYVDPLQGSDANDGQFNHPKKTIEAAVSATPNWCDLSVWLLGDITITKRIDIGARLLTLTSKDTRRTITFSTSILVTGGLNYRQIGGFEMTLGSVALIGVKIVMPPLPVEAGVINDSNFNLVFSAVYFRPVVVELYDVFADWPSSPSGYLFGSGGPVFFSANGVVLLASSLIGKVVLGNTSANGVPTINLPNFVSNWGLI